MFSYDLPGVDRILRFDEEFASVLQVIDGVGESRSAFESNHYSVASAADVAFIRLVLFKAVGHDGFALTGREYIGTQTDDTTRRNVEFDVYAVTPCLHRGHFAFAARHHIDHLAGELFGYVDGQLFNRFATLSVYFLVDDLGLSYLQFISFAAHGFNQDRKMKHTTS